MRRSANQTSPRTWDSPAYIAECRARAQWIRISYADIESWDSALLISTWQRDDPQIRIGPVMSASSGPKEYFRNDVITLFEANPDIDRVAAILLRRSLFLIYRVGRRWHDRTGREVLLDATI